MLFCRYLSTAAKSTGKTSARPALSEVIKQLSKFSSHNELLEYSQRPIEYYYPNRMIETCTNDPLKRLDLIQTAADLHNQLLVRIAHGIYYFQSLPFLPAANPILLSLHERYLKLFEMLAKFPPIKTAEHEEQFFHLINTFIEKTDKTIGRLSAGCQEAHKYFKSYQIIKEFLDNVLQNRFCMRLLAKHYLELRKQQKTNKKSADHWCGAINMTFSPMQTVQQCIENVSSVCLEKYSVAPHVQIENHLDKPLPYFCDVVEYILRELLKNAMRAVVEYNQLTLGNIQHVKRYFEDNRDLCKILITSDPDDEHFTIAIKDRGGGINESEEQIFRYMFSGNVNKTGGVQEDNEDVLDDFQNHRIKSSKQMYGYGFGLPICLLYAQLFAGSLTLRQVSHIGTDVYLRLGFLHTKSEHIKI